MNEEKTTWREQGYELSHLVDMHYIQGDILPKTVEILEEQVGKRIKEFPLKEFCKKSGYDDIARIQLSIDVEKGKIARRILNKGRQGSIVKPQGLKEKKNSEIVATNN